MGTLEPIRAGRARRRASCWSILEAMTWNLNAYSRASAGVGWLGRGAGGPVTPPVARSSSARLPPGPPAASARMPTRGQRRARARPCRRPCQPLIACLPVGMQARHPHSARSAWAGRRPGAQGGARTAALGRPRARCAGRRSSLPQAARPRQQLRRAHGRQLRLPRLRLLRGRHCGRAGPLPTAQHTLGTTPQRLGPSRMPSQRGHVTG